jgi:poly-beta-1,6-N-acetyl-D-glucosamine synthase
MVTHVHELLNVKIGTQETAIPMKTNYVVITPVRDEEKHIEATIASVISQTVRPQEWVIVNDGSSDETGALAEKAAREHAWIRVIHRKNRGSRKAGGGVVDAFYDGYKTIESSDWQFLVKLDGDLSFAAEYFQRCFEYFQKDPQLGIGGGEIHHEIAGQLKIEENPKFHVRGATKIYKRECWEAIGGLWPAAGWDTIDEVKANMLGWKTYAFADLHLLHHRFTGTADGLLRTRVKHGVVCYISGYHPVFLAARCLYRIAQKPYLIGAAAIFYGYVKSYWARPSRPEDPSYISYIRTQQLRRLCGMETIWR